MTNGLVNAPHSLINLRGKGFASLANRRQTQARISCEFGPAGLESYLETRVILSW